MIRLGRFFSANPNLIPISACMPRGTAAVISYIYSKVEPLGTPRIDDFSYRKCLFANSKTHYNTYCQRKR